jgi:hypothetical protein
LGLTEGGQEFVGDIGAQKIVGSGLDVMFYTKGGATTALRVPVTSVVPSLTKTFTETPSQTLGQETFNTKEVKAKDWKVGTIIKDTRGVTHEIKSLKSIGKTTELTFLSSVPSETETPIFTPTKTLTKIKTPVLTETPIFTPTETLTKTLTETPIFTPTETLTKIKTPVLTETPIFTPTETLTKTLTETPTETSTLTPTFTFTPTMTPTMTPTFTGDFMPFILPLGGGGTELGGKPSRTEKTRFIDEFTLAFMGLAKPSEQIYFGKEKSITKTRRLFAPKKKRRGRQLKEYKFGFDSKRIKNLLV